MKRQPFRKGTHLLCTFLTAGCLFLCSCGMEHFYLIEPPVIVSEPAESSDYQSHVSVFITKDKKNAQYTDIRIYGTAIFYRIYGSIETMRSEVESIRSVNTEYTESGYNRMQNYGYKEMIPRIPFGTEDKTVTIRLSTESVYSAGAYYTDSSNASPTSLSSPRRTGGIGTFTFTSQYKPAVDDIDAKVTSDVSKWYVPVFAVTYGEGTDSVQHYSQLEYLGYFTIE